MVNVEEVPLLGQHGVLQKMTWHSLAPIVTTSNQVQNPPRLYFWFPFIVVAEGHKLRRSRMTTEANTKKGGKFARESPNKTESGGRKQHVCVCVDVTRRSRAGKEGENEWGWLRVGQMTRHDRVCIKKEITQPSMGEKKQARGSMNKFFRRQREGAK